MDQIRPRELHVAARIADALVYAAGIAGVVAAGLLFRDGEVAYAVVAVVLTFVAGAGLRLAAWVARALALLLVRTEQMAAQLSSLHAAPSDQPTANPDAPPDPWRRWGGWH